MANEVELKSIKDPYSIFLYAMDSPGNRSRYTTRLRCFFKFTGLEGMVEQCKTFVENSMRDRNWAYISIVNFLFMQKQRAEVRKLQVQLLEIMLRRYFSETNDILVPWKKITLGLP